ncbi:MAG: glycosyltransferase family 4 protein [Moheibacter sp.]
MKKVFLESHNLKNRTFGFGIFNYELIKALSKIEHLDLDLILNVKNPKELEKEFGNSFRYNRYTSLQRKKWWGVSGRFDVWHCLNQNIKIEPRKKPSKYILTIHDVNFAENSSNKKQIDQFKEKLKRADLITYISKFTKNQTHSYFDVQGIEEKIIYNGNPITDFFDTSRFRSEVLVDKPYFYSIGEFLSKKNFEAIVRMMKEIPDYNLIISGNNTKPYGEKIRLLIKELNLENSVFLTGRVSEIGKQYYMKNCEAFLFPSIGEGFGLPPIEAMRFGKPVFLSNLTSLPEIGADAAFYWENFDPIYMKNLLFDSLNEFHNNQQFYSDKAKQRAVFFSWESAAKAYLNSYQ